MANSKYKQSQIDFLQAMAKLIIWAGKRGYDLTCGDFYAKSGHMEGSKHYERMAADLNLHIDGAYQRGTEAHRPIGLQWEKMGGTWGGRFAKKDGNHYSWGETR